MESRPRVGRLLLAITNEPQTTKAWARGAAGERVLGARLNEMTSSTIRVMHDRRIAGSRANIDHIAIAPSGVYVIDAKNYRGLVHHRDVGGLFRSEMKLYVGRRDCTKLVDGMARQVDAVRAALGDVRVPMKPVLCFIGAEWKLLAKPFEIDGVKVVWPGALVEMLQRSAPVQAVEGIDRIEETLAASLRAST